MIDVKLHELYSAAIWMLRNEKPRLAQKEVSVMYVMLGHYNMIEHDMFPKADTIAKLIGYTGSKRRDNVYRALATLRRLGVFSYESGPWGTKTYKLGPAFISAIKEVRKEEFSENDSANVAPDWR